MRLHGKTVNLLTLRDEMAAAGLDLPALGTVDDELVTYSDRGEVVELPDIVAAQAVVAAHTPPAPPKSDREILTAALKATPVVADKLALIEAWLEGADALAVAVEAQKAKIQPVIG